ncbi:CTL9 family protein [Megaselia abdita]
MMPMHQGPYMRPGTGIQVNRRIGELPVELEPHLRPPLKVINPPPFRQNFVSQQAQPYQTNSGVRLREVSETDLYLLGAIEKLVYRVDYLESRLRRTEQLVYYLMAGNNQKEVKDPCPANFSRVGDNCYYFSDKKSNWKNANGKCKAIGGHLTEFEKASENEELMAYLLNHPTFKGKDYWVGGLNPGLLWIWAGSAKPVNPNTNLTSLIKPVSTSTSSPIQKPQKKPQKKEGEEDLPEKKKSDREKKDLDINESENEIGNEESEEKKVTNTDKILNNTDEIKGNGRCLRLSYNPSKHSYQYFGQECNVKEHYICEKDDKTLDNKIKKIGRDLNLDDFL